MDDESANKFKPMILVSLSLYKRLKAIEQEYLKSNREPPYEHVGYGGNKSFKVELPKYELDKNKIIMPERSGTDSIPGPSTYTHQKEPSTKTGPGAWKHKNRYARPWELTHPWYFIGESDAELPGHLRNAKVWDPNGTPKNMVIPEKKDCKTCDTENETK